MSKQYPGGIISKTAPVPSGPYADSTAPGVWTLEQQAYWQKLGQWPTQGAVNPSAFIENLFSTYLYTGNGGTQTITNGIDLSTNGGLVWIKGRSGSFGSSSHLLQDSVRGFGNLTALSSNASDAQYSSTGIIQSATSSGFTTGGSGLSNASSTDYVAWTFREQPKFFDVVTYTGTGSVQTIAHNLGSVPGCIIVKSTSNAGTNWAVYHRSVGATGALFLQLTNATNVDNDFWNDTTPTSTVFTVRASSATNATGYTYVAYLFAHDAGGFGLTGTDNVISCGGFTHAGANAVQTLGYEPQFLLIKKVNDVGDWKIVDTMRGWSVAGPDLNLYPNTSGAEVDSGMYNPVATGFDWGQNGTFIYIAIRRGPMKVPTSGTSVLATVTRSGTSATAIITGASSPPDLVIVKSRSNATEFAFTDRLRGVTKELSSSYNFSEADFGANPTVSINMNGWTAPAGYGTFNQSGYTYVDYLFSRYPNVFDEVCYTGTGSATTQTHNLGVAPELIICKRRNGTRNWPVRYSTAASSGYGMYLDDTGGEQNTVAAWTTTAPTSTVFSIGASTDTNGSGDTYVAYLFATCTGVSKVGSYTGNGTTQTINCGFAGGARFVLIKRTDSTSGWYVYDTARGMTVLTDPYLFLNNTDAETATLGSVTTVSTGFALNSTILAAINVSGGTYIFLAIA